MTRSSGAGQILVHEVPIDQVVQEGLDEVGPPVLVVEIVSMLPDVDRQERRLAVDDQRRVSIVGVGDLDPCRSSPVD